MPKEISIIIPTLNAAAHLEKTVKSLGPIPEDVEVLIVDGGSIDETNKVAQSLGVQFYHAPMGRGTQLNYGIDYAQADNLFFLHADTYMPEQGMSILKLFFANATNQIGTFKMKFDLEHWALKFYGAMTAFDSLWTTFGDQGIAVRRSFLKQAGGFPQWPLFEDVEFLRRCRKLAKIKVIDAHVTTSAERFAQNGPIRQQLKNGWLMCKYLWGVSPERLSRAYH